MLVRRSLVAGAVLASGLVVSAAGAGVAQAATTPVCDAYSGTCTTPPATSPAPSPSCTPSTTTGGTGATTGTTGGGGTDDCGISPSGTTGNGGTGGGGTGGSGAAGGNGAGGEGDLPVTGGEAVLLTLLGLGALGGGTVLVLAGRRRSVGEPA